MEVVNLIVKIILCVLAVFLIAIVLLQTGKGGVGSAFGGSDAVVGGKSKARGRDAMLASLTKIIAIVFMVLAVALAVLTRIFA